MYSRDYLDDYDPSSTYLNTATLVGVGQEESDTTTESFPSRAERRKNEWKFAKRNQRIADSLGGQYDKPLHYYSKTAPEYYYQRRNKTNNKGKHRTAYGNYNPAKNWNEHDQRQIDNFKTQLDELFDEN